MNLLSSHQSKQSLQNGNHLTSPDFKPFMVFPCSSGKDQNPALLMSQPLNYPCLIAPAKQALGPSPFNDPHCAGDFAYAIPSALEDAPLLLLFLIYSPFLLSQMGSHPGLRVCHEPSRGTSCSSFKTSWQMNPQAARLLGESLSYRLCQVHVGRPACLGLLVHLS